MTHNRTGADLIVSIIKNYTNRMFVYPGGTVAPVIDSAVQSGVQLITARTEQGAGFAAIGAAKLHSAPEVILVSSGPGVTNLVTCIADSYFDSVPIVAICGQVGQSDYRANKPIRQGGFQEVDTSSIMSRITKRVFTPQSVLELRSNLEEAFLISTSGRPGPVVIDLHMNLQREILADFPKPPHSFKTPEVREEDEIEGVFFSQVIEMLTECERPLILAGAGSLDLETSSLIRKFSAVTGIPVTQSLHSLGILDSSDHLSLGFHGHTGERKSGIAIQNSDLILILGSRLDVRQTGTLVDNFAPHATKIRVDIDKSEIDYSRIKIDVSINCSVKRFMQKLVASFPINKDWHQTDWSRKIANLQEIHDSESSLRRKTTSLPEVNAYSIIRQIGQAFSNQEVNVVTGVGSHQQWVAREFLFDFPRTRWFTSGGLGTMGYDLPVSIGVSIADRERATLCFVGDGSFQMNIQELAFAKEITAPIKIIVLDNNRLGIVSQFQNMNWDSDPTCGSKFNPDFAAIATAYGIPSRKINTDFDVPDAVSWLHDEQGPLLLHVNISSSLDIVPMLLAGDAIDKMWPYDEN
jgi:acetolactate synthase-1/2/3 large subunit